jgi:hypothetical protein
MYPCDPQQEAKLAELDLVQGLLIAERALLYTLNFDVRNCEVLPSAGKYLHALGIYGLAGATPKPENPLNTLPANIVADLLSLVTSFSSAMWVLR